MKLHALLWVCLVLVPAQAFAQGTIAGVASDTSGRVLPGVTVTLSSGAAGDAARVATTDGAGRYEFRGVPLGTYSVTFALPGFGTLEREGVALPQGGTATVDATLRLAAPGALQFRVPPRPGEPGRRCLHGELESAGERQRREEALDAMRLIDRAIRTFPGARTQSPGWDEVSESALVRRLRTQGDELALRIRWRTSEPLPGWGIAWVTSVTKSRYALVDLRDPCGFTYSSEDPRVASMAGPRLL